mmetsp:Transcript_24400/g.50898  ORF Transcript_24400/g.50898 Transcript_24400/m.50898 type:complete len:90 (-) Transcript_24400:238-507(-)
MRGILEWAENFQHCIHTNPADYTDVGVMGIEVRKEAVSLIDIYRDDGRGRRSFTESKIFMSILKSVCRDVTRNYRSEAKRRVPRHREAK